MSQQERHFMQEADIGSGERKSGEHDTLKEVQKIRNPQMKDAQDEQDLKDDPNYQARSKRRPEQG